MEDLDNRIRRLSDLDRVPLIRELIRIDAQAQELARTGRRARLGSTTRNRAEGAQRQSERLVSSRATAAPIAAGKSYPLTPGRNC